MKKLAKKLDFSQIRAIARPVTLDEKVAFLRVVARSLAARMNHYTAKVRGVRAENKAYWAAMRESGVFQYPD